VTPSNTQTPTGEEPEAGLPPAEEEDVEPGADRRKNAALIALAALAAGLGIALGLILSDPPTEKIFVTQTETSTSTEVPTTTTLTTSTVTTTTSTTTSTDETVTSTTTAPPETTTVTTTVPETSAP
jgi:hypothetical protein